MAVKIDTSTPMLTARGEEWSTNVIDIRDGSYTVVETSLGPELKQKDPGTLLEAILQLYHRMPTQPDGRGGGVAAPQTRQDNVHAGRIYNALLEMKDGVLIIDDGDIKWLVRMMKRDDIGPSLFGRSCIDFEEQIEDWLPENKKRRGARKGARTKARTAAEKRRAEAAEEVEEQAVPGDD